MSGFKIEVPETYFASIAAKEYNDDAGMAVVREFAQNSTDAGATTVAFEFSGRGVGARLKVTDNGAGCDADRVRKSLLTPLGSAKGPDAIGGFGKAKELLYFSNPSWSIKTRDVRVEGSFLTVKRFEAGHEHFAGFEAEVALPDKLHTAAWNQASRFLAASERPGVRWVLNGSIYDCMVKRAKRCTKDFGFAKAYVDPTVTDDSTIYLRTGGLLTATRYGHHGSLVGRVLLELTGASSELLTPARDWFRADEHRRIVESWLNALVTDARQTLADDAGDELVFCDHEELDLTPEMQRQFELLAGKVEMLPVSEGSLVPVTFRSSIPTTTAAPALSTTDSDCPGWYAQQTPEQARGLAQQMAEVDGVPATVRVKKAKKQGFDVSLLPIIPGARRLTVHTGGKADARAAERWLKKHDATRALAAWATAVRAVAARCGLPVDSLGFTFKANVEAEAMRSKGRFAVLLNPTNIDLNAPDAAEELIDRALHELTHILGYRYHDEGFVIAEFDLRRKVRGALVRGAVARSLRTSKVELLVEV